MTKKDLYIALITYPKIMNYNLDQKDSDYQNFQFTSFYADLLKKEREHNLIRQSNKLIHGNEVGDFLNQHYLKIQSYSIIKSAKQMGTTNPKFDYISLFNRKSNKEYLFKFFENIIIGRKSINHIIEEINNKQLINNKHLIISDSARTSDLIKKEIEKNPNLNFYKKDFSYKVSFTIDNKF